MSQKNSLIIFLLLLWSISAENAIAQRRSVTTFKNGDLYWTDATLQNLQKMVMQKHQTIRESEEKSQYNSLYQTFTHYICLKVDEKTTPEKLAEAHEDLKNQMPFETFVAKYQPSISSRDLLVTKKMRTNDEGQSVILVRETPLRHEKGVFIVSHDPTFWAKQTVKETWLIEETDADVRQIRAFFFTDDFAAQKIPPQYAQQIGYASLMLDTASTIFLPRCEISGINALQGRKGSAVAQLMAWITEKKKTDALQYWTEDIDFQRLLKAATTEALHYGGSNEILEYYVEEYISAKTALQLKRGRRLLSEQSNREHLLNIANLAVKTGDWAVFIRAQMAILWLRREASEDNNAWHLRSTYTRELEAMGLDISKMIVGLAFDFNQMPKNHFFIDNKKIPALMREAKDADVWAEKLLDIIGNDKLDWHNRILSYNVFREYIRELPKAQMRVAWLEKLREATQYFPTSLTERLELED